MPPQITSSERAEILFEEILTLERQMLDGIIGASEFKAALEARKWMLSFIAPEKFGDTKKIDQTEKVDIAAELLTRLAKINNNDK